MDDGWDAEGMKSMQDICWDMVRKMAEFNDDEIKKCMRSCGYRGDFSTPSVLAWKKKHNAYIETRNEPKRLHKTFYYDGKKVREWIIISWEETEKYIRSLAGQRKGHHYE